MPTGRVKWFDAERGFGFVTNPGDDDAFVGTNVLPEGVTELRQGQKIEYEFATGRRGPQVLRILKVHDSEPGGRREREHRYEPGQLHSMIQDLITLLERQVQPTLEAGRFPDRREGHQVAQVLRAVARELDA